MKRALSIVVLLLLLAGCLAAVSLMLPARPSGETLVEITPGMGSREIGSLLASRGVIRSKYAFDLWRLARGGRLQAGEYRFADPANTIQVYNRLRRGDVYFRTVTIPEGYNLFEVAEAVQNAHVASKDTFLAAERRDVDLIADLDPTAPDLEGYLFPDTYRFQKMQTPDQMLAVMVHRFRQAAASIGLTSNYHRVVILASLVEKETPLAADRPLVASVFANRLAKGMPLMTDPAVIYAAMLANRYRGTIYESDLQADSPYNTYRHAGLPPGPICNPGLASLRAALHPAQTDYLYFVADADGSGHSRFAATLADHERNVSAYRKARGEQAHP